MTEKYTNEKFWQEFGTMKADVKNIGDKITSMDKKIDIIVNLGDRVTKLEERCGHGIERVAKLEDNQAKIVWAIIMAVLGAVLSLVIK